MDSLPLYRQLAAHYVDAIHTGSLKQGDKLLNIEAMKMETSVYAPVAGKVAEVHVKPGSSVESKDLLVTVEVGK